MDERGERRIILLLAGVRRVNVLDFMITLRAMGRLVDRFGSFRIDALGVGLAASATWLAFVRGRPGDPVILLFMLLMLANGTRNIATSTLATKVPRPEERARFMSLQNVIQHLGSFLGTLAGGLVLGETASGELTGMSTAARMSIAMMVAIPPMLFAVEARVARAAALAAPAPGAAA